MLEYVARCGGALGSANLIGCVRMELGAEGGMDGDEVPAMAG